MEFLYLSTLCSKKEYQRMFSLYGTVSSHASQKFNRSLLKGLKENGISVSTLSFRSIRHPHPDDLVHVSEEEEGIRYNYLPHCRNHRLNRLYTIWAAYRALATRCRRGEEHTIGVDVINGELSIAAVLFSMLHRKVKLWAIVTDVPSVRAYDTRKGLQSLPMRLKNALIYQYDSYVFLTKNMEELINVENRPYVIIEGIADDSPLPIPNTMEIKHAEKVIMLAGLLEKEFGIDRLLEVFHRIDAPNARLHLYGKGKSEKIIQEYHEKDSRICFFGEAVNSNILEEECRATYLINPRMEDGEWVKYSFPSKNIEYIASGTPMIAYRLSCIPEEYCPHFIEIKDDAFEQILTRCLSEPVEKVHQFGLENRAWILEHKSPQKQTERMASILLKKGD